jgi:hypothetical protein
LNARLTRADEVECVSPCRIVRGPEARWRKCGSRLGVGARLIVGGGRGHGLNLARTRRTGAASGGEPRKRSYALPEPGVGGQARRSWRAFFVARLLRRKGRTSKPAERNKRVEGSDVGEVPLALDEKSETMGLMLRDELEVVAGSAGEVVAGLWARRFAAVVKVELTNAVDSDVGKPTEARFDELASVGAVAVCTGGKAHFGPGQPLPGEIEEAEQVTPNRRADATAK